MPHKDILTLVHELRGHKTSAEEIKKKLLKKGYDIEDINGAIARAGLPAALPSQVPLFVTHVSRSALHRGNGIVMATIVFVLCISLFGATLAGTYWYASRSLSESSGTLAQIVENSSGTPALLPTEPALSTPAGLSKTPAYFPAPILSKPSSGSVAPSPVPTSALTSTQLVDSPTTPITVASTTSTPSLAQTIVQAITAPLAPPAAPTLTLTMSENLITYGGSATLSWTSTNTTSCTASQGWSGSQPVSGSETFSNVTSNANYAISCTGPGGTVTKYSSIVVGTPNPIGGGGGSPAPAPTPTPTPAPSVPLIAAGCAVPSGSGGNSFYVDPVNGSDTTGNGSQANPWKTLSTVLSNDINTQQYVTPYTASAITSPLNPSGPIHPGDTIYLMSGNYGAITVRGVNSDFITLEAAPGQTPVLSTLTVYGAAKWKIEGLKIQSFKNGYSPLVGISTQLFYGPVTNIIFDHNTVSSIDDSSGWSASDWSANAAFVGISNDENGGGSRDSTCITETNNLITNVYIGIQFGVDNSLLANNTVNNFGGDGVDYNANNILISHNLVENARHIDGIHPDAFQGQIGREDTSDPNAGYTNVTLDGNIVYRKTIRNLPFANYLQGIDAFDMNWTNLTVTNNVIVTDDYDALTYASVHNGLIANNTVIYDGCEGDAGCGTTAWLSVASSTHEGTPSTNVTVRNNIATEIYITSPAVTLDHNITSGEMIFPVNGIVTYYSLPGMYGNNNLENANLNAGFVQFDTTNLLYNLHLNSSSVANGFGIADQAPSVDIEGNPRVAPIAAGAYTSSYAAVSYGESRNSLLASVYDAITDLWKFIASRL